MSAPRRNIPLGMLAAQAGVHTAPGPAPARPRSLPTRIAYGCVGALVVVATGVSIATVLLPAWFDRGTLPASRFALETPPECEQWRRRVAQYEQLRRSVDQRAEAYLCLAKCRAGLAVPETKTHFDNAVERLKKPSTQ